MKKSRSVQYIHNKIKVTPKNEMISFIDNSPLKDRDRNFMQDILKGLSYKELETKYGKSEARIAQWKRSVYEQLHQYDYEILRK